VCPHKAHFCLRFIKNVMKTAKPTPNLWFFYTIRCNFNL
jgi:hypothetical protein